MNPQIITCLIGFFLGSAATHIYYISDTVEPTQISIDSEVFDRDARLRVIRHDALIGKHKLKDTPDSSTVKASNIEWVAYVIEDLPQIAPLAEALKLKPTVEHLRKIYIKVYTLADNELELSDSSKESISAAKRKLSSAIDSVSNH